MSIKLIALDLDDTLKTHETDFNQADLDMIEKARAAGIYVCLASGRSYKSLVPFYKQLALDTLTISTGGSIISDQNNKRMYTKFLQPKMAAEIIKYAHQNNYYAQVYFDDDFYYFKHTKHSDFYKQKSGVGGYLDENLVNMDEIDTPKILFIDDEKRIAELMPAILKVFPDVKAKRSYPYYLEVNHQDSSKGTALKALGEMLDIKPEEMMAIGDSEIDASMIEYAGIGVAMGNATQNVKARADYVTDGVLNAGVAKAIEKFCFND